MTPAERAETRRRLAVFLWRRGCSLKQKRKKGTEDGGNAPSSRHHTAHVGSLRESVTLSCLGASGAGRSAHRPAAGRANSGAGPTANGKQTSAGRCPETNPRPGQPFWQKSALFQGPRRCQGRCNPACASGVRNAMDAKGQGRTWQTLPSRRLGPPHAGPLQAV